MPINNVDSFRTGFKGVRSNRYIIEASFPSTVGTNIPENWVLYAKATSFPGSQIGMIPVSYQGRLIKFSGERSFGEWVIQVYDSSGSNDSKGLRKVLEKWMNNMDHHGTHSMNYNLASPSYWTIKYDNQVSGSSSAPASGTGVYSKAMRLYNVWPVDISPIDLSYESVDSFAEFTLTLAYDHHEIV